MLDEIKKLEWKAYRKYFIGILIGILPFIIFWETKGTLAAVFVIGGGILIILCLMGLSSTFDIFYKMKGRLREQETGEPFRETYIDWPPWLQKWGAALYGFTMLIGIKLFAAKHENDFGGTEFVWHSILAGLFIGIIIYSVLRLIYTNWTTNKNKSAEIAFYMIIASVFITVSLGPVINKQFATSEISCRQYNFEDSRRKRSDKNYIHLNIGDRSERFQPGPTFYRSLTDKDTAIILCIRKGALGYEYVHEFKKQ